MRKTKIICTLGPASRGEEMLRKLFLAGMNVGRMNMSHGSHEEHHENIERFRRIRDELGLAAAVLLDTKGPEIRIGTFANGPIDLQDGADFTLTIDAVEGDENRVFVTYPNLPNELAEGNTVLINDGMIELRVKSTDAANVYCQVIHGGKLSNRKGVNIPDVAIQMEFLSPQDKSDLLFGIEEGVDYVAASFVRTAQDAIDLREFLDVNGGERIKIIAKIENIQGINNFEDILKVVDGIMVARGDMGVEVDFVRLPGIQKHFISRCVQQGKIVITATQMLESMITNPVPTRAEISDVANAVFDGSTAVMLSGESAAGQFPEQAVRAMARICVQAENEIAESRHEEIWHAMDSSDLTNAVAHAAATLADDIDARIIIATTSSGNTACRMAKFHPNIPIIGATSRTEVYHQMALLRGVQPMLRETCNSLDTMFAHCIERVKEEGYVEAGDRVVITAGSSLNQHSTNTIRAWTVE